MASNLSNCLRQELLVYDCLQLLTNDIMVIKLGLGALTGPGEKESW